MNRASLNIQEEIIYPEVLLPEIPERTFLVTDYGALGDGLKNNTEAFHLAIKACEDAGGGKVIIPAGVWVTGPLTLKSKLEIHAEEGALVHFSQCFDHYPLVMSSYEGQATMRCKSPLDGDGLTDVAITGAGVFDGGGEAWRPVKKWKMTELQWEQLIQSGGVVDETDQWWPTVAALQGKEIVERLEKEGVITEEAYLVGREYLRPNLLSLRNCKRILLDGPTFQNSAAWCLHPWASEHITIRNVMVRNPWFAQNGDGLDLDSCRYAVIENCSFDVGDDAICLKSGKDEVGRALAMPCEYVTIRGCRVYHGHGGFVVGSEMSGGVRHVKISDCMFIGTDIGIRFKTARGRGGVVENIQIERITMQDIKLEAISFHMFYEGKEGSGTAEVEALPISVETPVFRDIVIRDVTCKGAQTALLFNGLAEMPIEGLTVQNMKITSNYGIVGNHVRSLGLQDVEMHIQQGPLVQLHQCQNIILDDVFSAEEQSEMYLSGTRTEQISWRSKQTLSEQRKVILSPEVVHRETIQW